MKDPELEIQIAYFENAYRSGTKSALYDCYRFCFSKDLPFPKWVKEEVMLFLDKGLHGKATLRGQGRTADPIKTQRLTEERILRAYLVKFFRQKGEGQLLAFESATDAITRLNEKFPDEIQKVESEQVRKDFYEYEKRGGRWYIREIVRGLREDNLSFFLGAAAAEQLGREFTRTGRWDGMEDFLKLLRTLTGPEMEENRRPPDKETERLKWLFFQAHVIIFGERIGSSPDLSAFEALATLVLGTISKSKLKVE